MNNLVRPFITIFTIFLLVFSASALPLQSACAEEGEPPFFFLFSVKESKIEKMVLQPRESARDGEILFRENERPISIIVSADIVPSNVMVEIDVVIVLEQENELHPFIAIRNIASDRSFFNSTSLFSIKFPPLPEPGKPAKLKSMYLLIHNLNPVNVAVVTASLCVMYYIYELVLPLENYTKILENLTRYEGPIPSPIHLVMPLENYTSLKSSYDSLHEAYSSLMNDYNSMQSKYAALSWDYTSLNSAYSMLQSEYYELSSRYNSLQTTYYQHTFILATVSIALACTSVALAVRRRKRGSEKRELKRDSDQAEGVG